MRSISMYVLGFGEDFRSQLKLPAMIMMRAYQRVGREKKGYLEICTL